MKLPGPGRYVKYAAATWTCCLTVAVCPAEPPASGGALPGGWEALHLQRAVVAGTSVYYEGCLEPNLPVLERELRRFHAAKETLADVLARREEILADVGGILGPAGADLNDQRVIFAKVATPPFAHLEPTFRIVRTATLKDFLRGGGQLPDFTYDRAQDRILYSPRISLVEGVKPPERFEFCIPIAEHKDFGACVAQVLGVFHGFVGTGLVDAAIHEVVEMTLVGRVRPADPYWRWFSDGFANALTSILIEKYLGQEAAGEFAARNEVRQYGYPEQELNLRYWMMTGFSVDLSPMPVKAEENLECARYGAAMAEARGLIDRHGVACVRAILDGAGRKDDLQSADLLDVIRDVTGEDMGQRLNRYQTFGTAAEGIAKYERAYQAAQAPEDYEQMFVSLLRLMELRGNVSTAQHLEHLRKAAWLLFEMGHEPAGDEVLRHALEMYPADSAGPERRAALECLVRYALDCNQPRKAAHAADELLQADPQHVWALVVKMLVRVEDGDLVAARDLAGKVRDLAPRESQAYGWGAEVLARDPNQPPGGNAPTEAKGIHSEPLP